VPSDGWPADYWNSEPADSPSDTAAPTDRWSEAPSAAYPTYNFRVKAGKAASLVLPVKSVPIGVSYLNAKDVRGSITIADANTYGLSLDQLRAKFERWYYDKQRAADARSIVPRPKRSSPPPPRRSRLSSRRRRPPRALLASLEAERAVHHHERRSPSLNQRHHCPVAHPGVQLGMAQRLAGVWEYPASLSAAECAATVSLGSWRSCAA